ncbi:MAG: HEAT repeat domain-containing protein [Candidatus Poseidoniia archaeon]|jgi:HEAT repeat protein|nr:HEAT repeat domain-containing protein [Candidatus Poseidoniia archaeon]MDP7607044.1 HEAT repeat domain-containing protein [Candidatus Poseidoniia archaeon]|tara:strand:- start:38 stop:967 length:930 start_codon:yes stop_codon:yes gene_type:complete
MLGDVRAVASLAMLVSGRENSGGKRNSVFEDGNLRVREAAAEALGKIGDVRAVKPLIKALRDVAFDVRLNAAFALGRIGEPAIESLIEVLEDGNGLDREAAVEALKAMNTLSNTGDARVVQPHIKLLEDKNRAARQGAAKVLGMIGDVRAVEPLGKVLSHDDTGYYAAEALAEIGEPAISLLIKELKRGRSYIAPLLEKVPPAAVGAEYERLELYDDANEWYTSHSMLEEAAAARRKKAEMGTIKVSQKVVHGDEVTKTEIKDSVVSKSSIGSGGKSKSEELRDVKALLDDGIIDDAEFRQMKKEILGK